MQYVFLDASALVKRYASEPGTSYVDALIDADRTNVVISATCLVEVVSGIRRKYNSGDLSKASMTERTTVFLREAFADFELVTVNEALFGFSFDLVLEEDLRTLDSLQLSAARAVATEVDELTFVCADDELVSTAAERGFPTANPNEEVAG